MPNRITKDGKEIIDWLGADGKLVMAADAVTDAIKDLPREKQRKVLEDAERQLSEQIKERRKETGVLNDSRDAVLDEIQRKLKDFLPEQLERYAELDKYVAPAIEDLDKFITATKSILPAPRTPGLADSTFPDDVPQTLAGCRDRAIDLAAKHPGRTDNFILKWHSLGFPTFELTGGLAAALCMTECRGLLGRDFKLPFASIAVQLPSPSPLVHPDGDVRFLLVYGRTDALAFAGPGHGANPLMPEPKDDEQLDEWTRRSVWPALTRFIVNLCVYINSLHGLPAPEGKRKPGAHSKRRETEPAPPQRWVLGRDIKLSGGMLQAARVAVSPGATQKQRAAYRMHARFMVRGHWRNQACGTRHSERKLRWIEPFWKGPEMAEGLARLYSVSEVEARP